MRGIPYGVTVINKLKKIMHLTEEEAPRPPLRLPGLRIIKTALAVFFCLLFYALVPLPYEALVITALIAAIISLRSSIQESFTVSFTRIQSTFIGALLGLISLVIKEQLNIRDESLIYMLFLAFFVAFIIWVSVSFFQETGAGLGAIVFLAIALASDDQITPLHIAIARFLDTMIGLIIALLVNRALPFRSRQEPSKEE